MRQNSITLKLLLLVISAFAIATISVLIIANAQLTKIIDRSQNDLYSEKLETIWSALYRSDQRLKKTGLIEAYSDDFKESAIRDLIHTYYNKPNLEIYPFIIDLNGMIVMHPILPSGDLSFGRPELSAKMLSLSEGGFESIYQGQKQWYFFKQFPEWNWVICYTVPLHIKYADALQFRNLLGAIMIGVTVLILLALSFVITKFTKPISKLTDAAKAMAQGNLDQEIDLSGADEVGTLARSFSRMRNSIKQTITKLEKENLERSKAEADLAKEKEQLAITLRSIGDGVITTDLSGTILLVNKAAEELTGWTSSEAVGSHIQIIFSLINNQKEPINKLFDNIIDNNVVAGSESLAILVAKNNRKKNIAYIGTPIRDAHSKKIGIVLVFRDITDQLRTEQELLKAIKLESIGVLAGGIAHDFNNILAAILGNINLSLLDGELNDQTRKRLTEAEKASVRAKALTQQLLTFSKGGAPIKELSSLDSVIKDSANFILHGDKVACEFDIPENLWLADIDRGQVSQVIQNIVLNASNAMVQGGLIRITCENLDITNQKSSFQPTCNTYVRIIISDNGIGIPANVIDKIFDPYFTTKQEGSGLGLAVCHSIISKHNGHIAVESTPGTGTTFTIHIPASPDKELPVSRDEGIAGGTCKSKIMVMDDEEQVRAVAKAMLNHIGHEMVEAPDGEEALRLYKKHYDSGYPIDIIIMDLTIPGGMGGQEAMKKVLAFDPSAKGIVSSGYSNDPIMANCNDYGFKAAIVKPYHFNELSKIIESVNA